MIVKPLSYEDARRLSAVFNTHTQHYKSGQELRINVWLNDLISAAARDEGLRQKVIPVGHHEVTRQQLDQILSTSSGEVTYVEHYGNSDGVKRYYVKGIR